MYNRRNTFPYNNTRKRNYVDCSGLDHGDSKPAKQRNVREVSQRYYNQPTFYTEENYETHSEQSPFSSEHSTINTNLIVNYLPQNFGDDELRELFLPCGAIESFKIVRDKKTGYSFGYGFVKFVNSSSASYAIQMLNGFRVLNKIIKVSFARPPSAEIQDTNLYISNLPRSTTEDDLTEMFSQFGTIVHKNVLYDKITNLSRGVAFVRFDRREQANAAIEAMDGTIPTGALEPIKVRVAENHGKQKASYVAGFRAGYNTQCNY